MADEITTDTVDAPTVETVEATAPVAPTATPTGYNTATSAYDLPSEG